MICDSLPATGSNAPLATLLVVALACIVAGVALHLLARSRGRRASTALVILLVAGIAFASAPEDPAGAATDCTTADSSLTVTQTSTMKGLAPGIAPVPITGLIRNNSSDSTEIVAVEVQITSVTTARGSPPGSCEASDYLLVDQHMPVGRVLAPGGSTPFEGASIGFGDTATNQDACQNAAVHLLYTANPA